MNYLKSYQLSLGLVPDGVVGKKTAAAMMRDLNIATPVHFAHFIAQARHESQDFSRGRENLNYSFPGLLKHFAKYFRLAELASYANKPVKIGNRIYANRMGNGDEASGDGFKYRGGGALQVTGKNNYQAYFKSVGLPEDSDPDLLAQGGHYFKSAKWYFDVNHVWNNCGTAQDCVLKVSKHINLGNANATGKPIGLDDRDTLTRQMFIVLNV